MSRPNEAEIREALDTLSAVAVTMPYRRALGTLREAVKPREVWPAKEAAQCLGVQPSNLGTVKGLPAPAQEFDRPSTLHPDKKMALYWRDEIEAHPKAVETAARRRAEKEGGR